MGGRRAYPAGPCSETPESAATCSGLAARGLLARCGAGQAESWARPLRRRLATIARPARVRMRSRKPCLRARRRLLGWKVRFTVHAPNSTGVSQSWTDDRPARAHRSARRIGASSDRSTVRGDDPQGQTGSSIRRTGTITLRGAREPTTVPGGRYQIEVDTPSNAGILLGSVDERRSPC